MTPFDFWKLAYQLKWATQADLQKAVSLNLITQDQMNQIIGTVQPQA